MGAHSVGKNAQRRARLDREAIGTLLIVATGRAEGKPKGRILKRQDMMALARHACKRLHVPYWSRAPRQNNSPENETENVES